MKLTKEDLRDLLSIAVALGAVVAYLLGDWQDFTALSLGGASLAVLQRSSSPVAAALGAAVALPLGGAQALY